METILYNLAKLLFSCVLFPFYEKGERPIMGVHCTMYMLFRIKYTAHKPLLLLYDGIEQRDLYLFPDNMFARIKRQFTEKVFCTYFRSTIASCYQHRKLSGKNPQYSGCLSAKARHSALQLQMADI